MGFHTTLILYGHVLYYVDSRKLIVHSCFYRVVYILIITKLVRITETLLKIEAILKTLMLARFLQSSGMLVYEANLFSSFFQCKARTCHWNIFTFTSKWLVLLFASA